MGNLTGDPERWKKSFEVYADCLPSGTISVECAAAPESHLTGVQQVLRLQTESSAIVLRVPPGKTTLCKVPAIKYRVVPDELVNPLETVVAEADIKEEQVPGPTVHLNVEVKGGSGLDRAMAVRLLKTTAHAENTVYKGSVRTKPGSTHLVSARGAGHLHGPGRRPR